jgi:hypothetical protein
MKSIQSLAALALLAVSTSAIAAPTWEDRIEYRAEENKFSDREWRYDLAPMWWSWEGEAIGDGRFEYGAGVNYFFTQFLGVSGDTGIRNLEFPNYLNLSVVGRYPNEMISTAPYLFAGGGRQFFDGAQWTAHIGGGLDYRWNNTTGVFVDVRRTFAFERRDFFLFRFGVRFGF